MSSSSGAAGSASAAAAAPQLFLTSELFTSAGLDSRVWKCLSGMRLSRMSAVQAQAIPVLLGGSNAIVKAKTGSGKTLAYAVPLVQQILLEQEANPDEQKRELSRIVLLPTHELCEQVRSTIQSLLKFCSDCVKVVALKADAGSPAQTRALNEAQIREASPNILVATPAQLLAYCKDSERSGSGGRKGGAASGTASLKASLRHLVLDEADLVLGMGYESELSELLSNRYLGHGFQISLFSATLDPQIENLRNLYLGDRAQTVVVEDASSGPDGQPKLSQFYLNTSAQDKYMLAYAFLQLGVIDKARRVLFFISTIADAYRLKLFLGHFSVRAAVLNHELPYNSRQNILEQFNRGIIDILIATDEAAGEAADEAVESKRAGKRNAKGNKRTASALKEEEDEDEDCAVKEEEEEDEDGDEPAAKKSKTTSGAAAAGKKHASKAKLEEDEDEDEAMGVKDEDEAQLDADVEALAKLDKATPAPVRTKGGRKGRAGGGAGGGASGLGSANVSRGVDFKDVGTVVNFDFPRSVKNYIHRVGRTARADRAGVALSFVCPGEEPLLQAVLDTQIERSVRLGALPEQAQAQLQALPFDTRAVDAFRYRCSDKMRAVTTLAIREERLSQIKAELVNSDKLRAHWEDNPRELNLLKHDRVLRNARIQKHLATVPAYLLPEGMTPADANAAAPSAAANDANRNKLRRNKHKNAISAGNQAKKLGLDKVKGIAGARAKGRHTMATKNAADPLRSFRAKPIAANAFSASSSNAGAAKAKVDF